MFDNNKTKEILDTLCRDYSIKGNNIVVGSMTPASNVRCGLKDPNGTVSQSNFCFCDDPLDQPGQVLSLKLLCLPLTSCLCFPAALSVWIAVVGLGGHGINRMCHVSNLALWFASLALWQM